MDEIRRGLWHWSAPHPAWNDRQSWQQRVSSYAYDDGERLLLFDPLDVPDELRELATRRAAHIVLTCPWHRRDAVPLASELGAQIHVPPPDGPDPDPVPGLVFEAGDVLDIGVEARAGLEPNDLVLWIPAARAIVTGDTLIDFGAGLVFPTEWATTGVPSEVGVSAAELLAGLQPLLDLPVDVVLPTHGVPSDRTALERALAIDLTT